MARHSVTIGLASALAAIIGLPLIADDMPEVVLAGTLVYDTQPYPEPTIVSLPIGKVRNESLLVNQKNGGIANAVVSLTPRTNFEVVAHKSKNVVVRATNTGFSPRVVALHCGDELQVNNRGTVAHNINIASVRNVPVNEILSPGDEVTFTPSRPERWPVSLQCNVKSWMTAWIVVSDSPHVAVSDENGEFQFHNVPPGEYDVRIWQRDARARQQTC